MPPEVPEGGKRKAGRVLLARDDPRPDSRRDIDTPGGEVYIIGAGNPGLEKVLNVMANGCRGRPRRPARQRDLTPQ